MNPSQQQSSPPVDARVACVDGVSNDATTNKACPAGFDKLDDHGRGGFRLEAGKFYTSRDGKIYGPMKQVPGVEFAFVGKLEGEDWHSPFREDGRHCEDEGCSYDLIAPWIDWKAECERKDTQIVVLRQFLKRCLHYIPENDLFRDRVLSQINPPENPPDEPPMVQSELASLKGEGAGA